MAERKAHLHRIAELDGVRGIAVLAVMFLHFHAPFAGWRPLGVVSDVLMQGWAGVDIFFVLSGFLITSILISTRNASNYFRAFYARRALRIFPLAFAFIALFYWLALPVAHRHGLLPKLPESEQIWYWLFVGNWRQGLGLNDGGELGHFWSLAIEEQFYILFSLLARSLSNRKLAVCSGLLAASSIVLRAVVYAHGGGANPLVWRLTFLHLDPIAFGALLACSAKLLENAAKWRWVLIGVGAAMIAFHLPAQMDILGAGLLASGLVSMAATRQVKWLRWPVLTSCGQYSYAMYVLHPAWLFPPLAKKFPHSWALMWTALLLGPAVSYGIGWLSWQVLEKRFNGMKSRFPYRYDPGERVPEKLVIEPAG